MGSSVRTRIAVYISALLLTVGVFIAAGLITWRQRDFWERQLRQVQVDSVQFAEEYRAAFLELNTALLRFRLSHEPALGLQFSQSAAALSRQLADQARDALVPESQEILRQLMAEFARYRKDSEALFDTRPAVVTAPSQPEQLGQVEASSQRVLSLDARLGAMQREVLASFVTRVRLEMDLLWDALYAGMAIMLLCGAVLAWVAYRDLIAPLRRTVAQSRALLERQEKLGALGLIVAGLAHEIRNPLNSIKARLFTQRRVLGESSPGLEDNRFIDEEIDRLEGTLSEALQFARPAAPAFQRLRMADTLQPFCELLEPSLRKSEIHLEIDFRADPEVMVDPNQLKQAVLNLIKNASESIGRNGTIVLRTHLTTVRRRRRKQPALALEIEDTGPGMAPDVQKRLFDPFFTTKETGTGLGLSIAARIAQAHGGLIEFWSEPGRGALFRILLPLTTEPRGAQ
jgi:signal transduction histidine kinase